MYNTDRAQIEAVVRRIGVRGTYLGLRCLVCGVELACEDGRLLTAVTKELYPAIARRVGGSGRTVERNLRTVIRRCWQQGDRRFLDEVAGFHLEQPPTSGELIDLLAHYVRAGREEKKARPQP